MRTQSCPTLCDAMDCSPSGSPAHGISQARIVECVVSFSRGDLPDPEIETTSETETLNTNKIKKLTCIQWWDYGLNFQETF